MPRRITHLGTLKNPRQDSGVGPDAPEQETTKLATIDTLQTPKPAPDQTLLRLVHNSELIEPSSETRCRSNFGRMMEDFSNELDRQIAEIMRL